MRRICRRLFQYGGGVLFDRECAALRATVIRGVSYGCMARILSRIGLLDYDVDAPFPKQRCHPFGTGTACVQLS